MASAGDKFVGRVLHDTFVVDEPIGEGGMGVVYGAHNAKTPGIRYAIKVLRTENAALPGEGEVQRFKREAQVLASLDHPAIVRPIHVDVTPEGEPYLVMEFVRGVSLRSKIESARREGTFLPLPFVATVIDGIADALDHAHAAGVVHRDLKPENVLIVESGRSVLVKVLDFGIAKIFRPDGKPADTLTKTTELAGTVAYMSPEQCRDLRTAGPPSDRFSLGVIAFEMLTGTRPFDGSSAPSTICNVLLNPLPTVQASRPELPAGVDDVLGRACAKEPEARFVTAAALATSLAEALGVALGAVATEPPRRASQPRNEELQSAPTIRATTDPKVVQSEPTRQEPAPTASREPVRASALDAGWLRSVRTQGAPGRLPLWAVVLIVLVAAAGSSAAIYFVARPRPPSPDRNGRSTDPPAVPCAGHPREPTAGLYDDEICMPGGSFWMGSAPGEGDADEHPRHRVTLRPFYIDRYEVTVARYRRCVAAGACDASGLGNEGPYDDAGNYDARGTHYRSSPHCTFRDHASTSDPRPVNCVSFAQAQQVCRFEGRRLLSEAEWERAARGPGDHPRTYPWGDDPPDCNRASFGYGAGCGLADPVDVGTAQTGATPDGVFDLAGNVAEWTSDWYSELSYAHAPASDPPGATPDEAREHGGDVTICRDGCRVTRGGAWNTPTGLATFLRGAHRTADAVERRGIHLGVRCGRSP